jgi:hypothetical protein
MSGDHSHREPLRAGDAEIACQSLRCTLELMIEGPEQAKKLEDRIAGDLAACATLS